jgi:hypothetical protein
MPAQELADFAEYWNLSMFQEDGRLRNPGGNPENGGVDYSQYLIPWCKGNSVSVDQSTLQGPRDLISLLLGKFRKRLYLVESGAARRLGHQSGVTLNDLKPKFGQPFTKFNRRHQARDINPRWLDLERLLQVLLADGHIALFSESETLHPRQQQIIDMIRNDGQTRGLLVIGERGQPRYRDQMYIANSLDQSEETFGHIRMSRSKGWELYLRDHYGAPDGVEGVIPGSLTGDAISFSNKAMPLPLHLVFAETMARAMYRGNEWGKNQSVIRRRISDIAIEGDGTSVSLDEYYTIFAQESAPHMADYFLGRSTGDIAAAKYEVFEVPDSDPKSWRARLDPDMVRWREIRRDRERERQ